MLFRLPDLSVLTFLPHYIKTTLFPVLVLNVGTGLESFNVNIFPRETGLAFQQVTKKEARLYSYGLP